jgi:hypothetical protein
MKNMRDNKLTAWRNVKKGLSVLTCTVLLAPNAHAASLSKKQRWLMRFAGVGLVGLGFLAQSQEQDYNSKAADVVNNFNATHPNTGAANYANDEFSALSQQSAYQRNSNAWSIGRDASWSAAGLLVTASFIPDTWVSPTQNNDGIMIGHRWAFGLPHKE